MVIDVQAVPERLSRSKYVEMIRSLGSKPSELRRLEFRIDGVYAEVKARKPNGAEQVTLSMGDATDDEIAAHTIFIPVDVDS